MFILNAAKIAVFYARGRVLGPEKSFGFQMFEWITVSCAIFLAAASRLSVGKHGVMSLMLRGAPLLQFCRRGFGFVEEIMMYLKLTRAGIMPDILPGVDSVSYILLGVLRTIQHIVSNYKMYRVNTVHESRVAIRQLTCLLVNATVKSRNACSLRTFTEAEFRQ